MSSKIDSEFEIDKEAFGEGTIKTSLSQRLKFIEDEIALMLSKYNVSSYEEFLKKFEKGEFREHPTWEDLIVLENLINAKKMILRDLRKKRVLN